MLEPTLKVIPFFDKKLPKLLQKYHCNMFEPTFKVKTVFFLQKNTFKPYLFFKHVGCMQVLDFNKKGLTVQTSLFSVIYFPCIPLCISLAQISRLQKRSNDFDFTKCITCRGDHAKLLVSTQYPAPAFPPLTLTFESVMYVACRKCQKLIPKVMLLMRQSTRKSDNTCGQMSNYLQESIQQCRHS